jgi:hypothetical protein
MPTMDYLGAVIANFLTSRITVFVAGVILGGTLAIGLLMEKPIEKPKLTANENYLYDYCL